MDAANTLEQVEERLQSIQSIIDYGEIEFGKARLDAISAIVKGLTCSAKDKLAALARWKQQGLLLHADEDKFKQLVRKVFTSSTAAAPLVGDSYATMKHVLALHNAPAAAAAGDRTSNAALHVIGC
jgi:hypothetical protein